MTAPDIKELYVRIVRIGEAIERAARELPDGSQVVIEVERGDATVWLWIPQLVGELMEERIGPIQGDDVAESIGEVIKISSARHDERK